MKWESQISQIQMTPRLIPRDYGDYKDRWATSPHLTLTYLISFISIILRDTRDER